MNPDVDSLIHRYLDGSISAAELQQLNQRLLANAATRRRFSDWLNLDSALAAAAAGEKAILPATPPNSLTSPRTSRFTPTHFAALAACLAVLLTATIWWSAPPATIATVVSTAGVAELAAGTAIHPATHHIRAGSLELLTALGTRLVIEAPATFRFQSAQRLHLIHGRLSADVPPSAKGFTVITPTGEAVDLGTRFGVDVPASGPSEIHVFQGEVIAQATGAPQNQSVRTGAAVTMTNGSSTGRELRSAAFIHAEEMSPLSAALASGQHSRSTAALAALRQDPALIALLDFESSSRLPGVYRTAQGRWPGSQAPEFVHEGDHLKLDVGGDRDWPQLTLAAWVRIDRLGAPYQSLFHTDGWSHNNPGQVHWMITQNTTMRLALIGNTLAPESVETQGHPDSLTPVLTEQGRWLHLATVYDSVTRSVRFYLNGQFDKETRHQIAQPARLGPAQIGNWNQIDRKLSGRIDELILLGRRLSDAEILALYEAGNPYHH